MTPRRFILSFIALLALAPLGGCEQFGAMFDFSQKPPSMDAQGRKLSRGVVVSVRNVKVDPPKPVASAIPDSKGQVFPRHKPNREDKNTPGADVTDETAQADNDMPVPQGNYALEYRILQDDGTMLVIVTPGSEADAITPGERVLVIHGDVPKVMLETPLGDGQGV